MEKTEPMETIKNITIGRKDSSGYEIIDVLATRNEYAIYEINHKDINNRLRVTIDGYTNESEDKLIERFNKVKQNYIKAKGLLYRSSNFGMMKNRVAHTLSTSLSSTDIDGNKEFITLIEEIESEHKSILTNRLLYILPSILSVIIIIIISLILSYSSEDNHLLTIKSIILVMLASSLGGSLSIFINTKNLHFEEYTNKIYYFFLGFERIFLAFLVGLIAFILIQSSFILPNVSTSEHWKILSILIGVSFSEVLIPSLLGKVIKENS